jgi:hypothetical protein
VVIRHHGDRSLVGNLRHAGHDALRAKLQQDPGQAECFIARSGGDLPQLARRQHHMRRNAPVRNLIGEQWPVGQLKGRKQRILPYVRAVGGDVHHRVGDQGSG